MWSCYSSLGLLVILNTVAVAAAPMRDRLGLTMASWAVRNGALAEVNLYWSNVRGLMNGTVL